MSIFSSYVLSSTMCMVCVPLPRIQNVREIVVVVGILLIMLLVFRMAYLFNHSKRANLERQQKRKKPRTYREL